jgi:hypothetical protein
LISYYGAGLPSKKKPPLGPLSGNVAAEQDDCTITEGELGPDSKQFNYHGGNILIMTEVDGHHMEILRLLYYRNIRLS